MVIPARRFAAACLLVVLQCGASGATAADDPALPRAMAWSAYNLGTTGYNQAVAIGKVLERVFQCADRRWGPLPLRLVMTSNGDSNQALAVAADTGITRFAELEGRRVPYVRGAPALNVSTEAFLACGGLGWDDVERVEFPGYGAMWTGIVNAQVDAAYATTVSGPTRKLEASPRGIRWPAVPHDDDACWARLRQVAPYFTKHVATRGAGISAAAPHEGATYPYPLLIALDSTDAGMVHAMAGVIHRHYDEFKSADPGAIGWAMDRQLFDWVVPYHAGAVRYFREIGVWNDTFEAHNQRLLERQSVLAAAWDSMAGRDVDADAAFTRTWLEVRAEALTAAGFDPVWITPSAP